jgi:hypothetical protein
MCALFMYKSLVSPRSRYIIIYVIAYLCSDFNQIHGRHVMRPEDIAPVATEYQRYKVIMPGCKRCMHIYIDGSSGGLFMTVMLILDYSGSQASTEGKL